MRPKKDLFLKISEALDPLIISEKLRYVDLDKGQLSAESGGPTLVTPAVLINVPRTEYQMATRDRADGDAQVSLLVVFENSYPSFNTAQDKKASLDMLDLIDEVTEAALGAAGECFDELHLSSEEQLSYRYRNYQVHSVGFECETTHKVITDAKLSYTAGAQD
jgi:hypothetical protein